MPTYKAANCTFGIKPTPTFTGVPCEACVAGVDLLGFRATGLQAVNKQTAMASILYNVFCINSLSHKNSVNKIVAGWQSGRGAGYFATLRLCNFTTLCQFCHCK